MILESAIFRKKDLQEIFRRLADFKGDELERAEGLPLQ
jgi:hypothetical protein